MADSHIGRRVQARIFGDGAMGHRPPLPLHPDALEQAALASMSTRARAYIGGGAGGGATMRANRAAFDRWRIVPRMMRDTRERDQSVRLLGRGLPSPLLTAPIGVAEMVHADADEALAAGARDAGVPVIISTPASRSTEQIAAALGDGERWFQLYWSADEDLVDSFIARAEASGCTALVVTLDTTLLGWRPEDLDLGYLPFARGLGIAQYTSDPVFNARLDEQLGSAGPSAAAPTGRPGPGAVGTLVSMSRAHPGRLRDNLRSPRPRAAVQQFLELFSRQDLTWAHLRGLTERTSLPILVKGIQHPDDARAALDAGAAGVIVSNHGGRQVDGAIGSLDALPTIADAVANQGAVLFDSGVRTASDVIKALALGADAVCIGRPWVYGLALGGADGVRRVLEGLRAELDLTMALAGVTSIEQITRDLVVPAPAGG